MNAKNLMIVIAKAQGEVLQNGHKKTLELVTANFAYRLGCSNARVCNALELMREAVSDLQADDLPDFVNALKYIVEKQS